MAETFTPNAVARLASTKDHPFTDKQVRGWARDNMPRFDKSKHPARQTHVYSATERTAIIAGLHKRAGIAAPKVRKPRAPKPETTA